MNVYMLIPKTREIVKDAQKEGHKISTYSKGLVVTKTKLSGEKEFRTYSYFGQFKKSVRHDVSVRPNSTENRFRIENKDNSLIKEYTVTRFNDGLKVLFDTWSVKLGKNVEKSKQFSAEYKTFEGEVGDRTQTGYLFRYL